MTQHILKPARADRIKVVNRRPRLCLLCGHESVGPCSVSLDVRAALVAFAREEGRTWKARLRLLWDEGNEVVMHGQTTGGFLRQARNIIGPSGLDRITTAVLARISN